MNLPGTVLTKADLATLADPSLAEQAQLRRVDSETGSRLIGRNGPANYAGIIFPYIWPGDKDVREYRLRRDEPDLEENGTSRPKERNKYLSPPGRSNMLYLVPGTDPAWLTDASLPIVITEGEKKALALWFLAWRELGEAADMPRFLPVAVPGVWNWRGTVGKTEGPHGERRNVKGVIPDLGKIAWCKRQVTILFDANVDQNESVRIARAMLASELRARGAKVLFIDIPVDAGVNGVDDLVGAWGPAKVLDIIQNAAYDPKAKARSGQGAPYEPKKNAYERKDEFEAFIVPRSIEIRELMTLDLPTPTQLIEHILPGEGMLMMIGLHKSGKTVLAIQMALAVASGKALFDYYRTEKQGGVMVIEQDDPGGEVTIKNIASRYPGAEELPLTIVPKQKNLSFGQPFLSWLEEQIEVRKLRLVVLDSYSALRPSRKGGCDIVKVEYDELSLLDELGKRAKITLMVLHHVSGSKWNRDWAEQAGGTFAMGAAPEGQIHVSRFKELESNATERLVRVQGRHLGRNGDGSAVL
jgi:hypothetical protein